MSQQEYGTPGDALAHFGKKGMKWGVRNNYASKGDYRRAKNLAITRARYNMKSGKSSETSQDAVTAKYLKTGEKAVLGILAFSVATIPIAAAVGYNRHARYKTQQRVTEAKTAKRLAKA